MDILKIADYSSIYSNYNLIFHSVQYVPHRRHDIESVVKTLAYLLFGLKLPPMQESKPISNRAAECYNFWQKIYKKMPPFWKSCLELSKNIELNNYKINFKIIKHIIWNNFEYIINTV